MQLIRLIKVIWIICRQHEKTPLPQHINHRHKSVFSLSSSLPPSPYPPCPLSVLVLRKIAHFVYSAFKNTQRCSMLVIVTTTLLSASATLADAMNVAGVPFHISLLSLQLVSLAFWY